MYIKLHLWAPCRNLREPQSQLQFISSPDLFEIQVNYILIIDCFVVVGIRAIWDQATDRSSPTECPTGEDEMTTIHTFSTQTIPGGAAT